MRLNKYSYSFREIQAVIYAEDEQAADAIMAIVLVRGNDDPEKKYTFSESAAEFFFFQS